MKVEQLIKYLSWADKDSIVLVDIGQEESAEIEDVLIGTGTGRGFTYIKANMNEKIKVPDCFKPNDSAYYEGR